MASRIPTRNTACLIALAAAVGVLSCASNRSDKGGSVDCTVKVESPPPQKAVTYTLPTAAEWEYVAPVLAIDVGRDGVLSIDGTPVTRKQAEERIKRARVAHKSLRLTVRTDRATPFGPIVSVMDIAKRVGVRDLGFPVQPVTSDGWGDRDFAGPRVGTGNRCPLPPGLASNPATSVGVEVVVGLDGKVVSVTTEPGSPSELSQAAAACARLIRYRPSRDKDGQPYEDTITVRLTFSPD